MRKLPKRKHAASVVQPLLLACVLCASAAGTSAAADRLPNLQPRPASDIRVSSEGGRTLLRFTSTIGNMGAGPLELRGGAPSGGKQAVDQRIFRDDGTYKDVHAGFFTYHEAHQHIHFDGFARYVLQPITVQSSGKVSEKTTFCLLDVMRIAKLPRSPKKAYYNNCDSQVQGLSVGWADVYAYYLDGQYFDITDAPHGEYKIIITADPNNKLFESNDNDNVSELKIKIGSGGVTVLSSSG